MVPEHTLTMRVCHQADYEEQGDDQWGNGKILLLPTVIVNGHQYRGRLDVPSVMRALCAGFSESTEPEVRMSPVSIQYNPTYEPIPQDAHALQQAILKRRKQIRLRHALEQGCTFLAQGPGMSRRGRKWVLQAE